MRAESSNCVWDIVTVCSSTPLTWQCWLAPLHSLTELYTGSLYYGQPAPLYCTGLDWTVQVSRHVLQGRIIRGIEVPLLILPYLEFRNKYVLHRSWISRYRIQFGLKLWVTTVGYMKFLTISLWRMSISINFLKQFTG